MRHLSITPYKVIILGLFLLATSCAPVAQTTRVMPMTFPQNQTNFVPVQPAQPETLVPYIPPSVVPRSSTVHEVAPMESLWRISKMYDVSQNSIIRANNLLSDQLEVGQKLTIPNAAPLKPLISLYPNKRWKFIVIHHTASDIGNAKMVNEWHQNRGFKHGLGYHFLIDNGTAGKLDGQIETSPRWIKQERGAHCKAGNMNEKGIGISLVGQYSNSYPSEAQMDSLTFLVRELMDYYDIPAYRVIRHRDAPGAVTECPGNLFPWAELKRRIS